MLARPSLKPGDVIGNYRVVRLVGAGGMGEVYEVVHLHIARRAALKVLTCAGTRPELATRFVNEARAANVVSHPGTVQVFEYGLLAGGAPWLLMEFIDGETLAARISELRAGTREAGCDHLSVLYQLSATLAELHLKGVVHRDLKPSNIILTPDSTRPEGEQAKLLDFGIAKLMHNSLRLLPDGRPADPGTVVGAFLGTPEYMAPEQCRSAADVDARADVYALGVIAYELMSGRLPFEGEPLGIVMCKAMETAPQLCAPGVPSELSALIMSMVEREPTRRPTMSEVSEMLARLGGRGLSGAQVRKLVSSSSEHRGLATPLPGARLQRMLIGSIGVLTGLCVSLMVLLGGMYFSCGSVHGSGVAGELGSTGELGGPASGPELSPPAAPAAVDMRSSGEEDPADPAAPQGPPDMARPPVRPPVVHPRPRLCASHPVTPACIAGLPEGPKQAVVRAAARAELRLCAGQSITLVHPASSFLRCRPGTAAPPGVCERFSLALDAMWDSSWPIPDVVEVKCPPM
jgi:hypothetical protein